MSRTKQDIFDTVAKHLLTQNQKSQGDLGEEAKQYSGAQHSLTGKLFCLYRDAAGCSCAIGCLIPDDKYAPDLEGLPISSSPRVQEAADIATAELDLARALQRIHDNCDVSAWRYELFKVAKRFCLNPAVVDQFSVPA